jgi:hypothetical protein
MSTEPTTPHPCLDFAKKEAMMCYERNLRLLSPNARFYMHEDCPQLLKDAFDKCVIAHELIQYLSVTRPKPSESAK